MEWINVHADIYTEGCRVPPPRRRKHNNTRQQRNIFFVVALPENECFASEHGFMYVAQLMDSRNFVRMLCTVERKSYGSDGKHHPISVFMAHFDSSLTPLLVASRLKRKSFKICFVDWMLLSFCYWITREKLRKFLFHWKAGVDFPTRRACDEENFWDLTLKTACGIRLIF